MSDKFIRAYRKFDLNDIKGHMMIYGGVSAQCSECQERN